MCRGKGEGGRRCPHHQKGTNLAKHNERRRANRAIKAGLVEWAQQNGVASEALASLRAMPPGAVKAWAADRGLDPDAFGPQAPGDQSLGTFQGWENAAWSSPQLRERILFVCRGRQGDHPDDRRLLEGTPVAAYGATAGVNETLRVELDNGAVGYHKAFDGLDHLTGRAYGQDSAEQPVHEVAAWHLAKRLGPPWETLVAPCVLREINGRLGSFSLERPGSVGRNPYECQWWEEAALFDSLTGAQDRHPGNYLVDRPEGRLTLIDHGFSFSKPGDVVNASILAGGRVGRRPLREHELSALDKLLSSSDSLGLKGVIEPTRLSALRTRADRLRRIGLIVPPHLLH